MCITLRLRNRSEWNIFKHWLMSQLLPGKDLAGVTHLVGTHYDVVSWIYRMLGAKIGRNVNASAATFAVYRPPALSRLTPRAGEVGGELANTRKISGEELPTALLGEELARAIAELCVPHPHPCAGSQGGESAQMNCQMQCKCEL